MSNLENASESNRVKPSYVSDLEAIYGPPSQEAFGPAVFFERMKSIDLEGAALEKYRYFIGDLWERYGQEAWMGPWKEVYQREPGAKGDIAEELRSIVDSDARMSVPLFLEGLQDPQEGYKALAAAFDDPLVTDLNVYNIGDGGAMSGLIIAAWRKKTQEVTFLVFLMD